MQKWHAGNRSPGLARKTGIIAGFGKAGIKKKKNQNLFFRAEVLGTAKGHTEELSCTHVFIPVHWFMP